MLLLRQDAGVGVVPMGDLALGVHLRGGGGGGGGGGGAGGGGGGGGGGRFWLGGPPRGGGGGAYADQATPRICRLVASLLFHCKHNCQY